MNSRNFWRLLLEIVVFFIIPALLAGYFYQRVIIVFSKQQRRVSRNRQLSIAFGISWFLWVVCWIPSYVVSLMQLLSYEQFDSLSYNVDSVIGYLASFRVPIQMLYSHINPFVYLVVLKKFQEHHLVVYHVVEENWNDLTLNGGRNS